MGFASDGSNLRWEDNVLASQVLESPEGSERTHSLELLAAKYKPDDLLSIASRARFDSALSVKRVAWRIILDAEDVPDEFVIADVAAEALADGSAEIRACGMVLLTQAEYGEDIRDVLWGAITEADETTQLAALEYSAQVGDSSLGPAIVYARNHASESMRSAAVVALAGVGGADMFDPDGLKRPPDGTADPAGTSAEDADAHFGSRDANIDLVPSSRQIESRNLIARAFNTRGRFNRGEFATIYLGSTAICWVLFPAATSDSTGGVASSAAVLWLLFVIPLVISVGIRRAHDLGRSGAFLLWTLIPFVGLFVMFYLFLVPGTPEGTTKWG